MSVDQTSSSVSVAYDEPQARWMSWVVLAAGVYNVAWGTLAVLAPDAMLRWFDMQPPHDRDYWQCIGMMVTVLGVGYVVSALNPVRHWPIVLVGLLGKTLAAIGFVRAALAHRMTWSMGWMVLFNHVVWLVPFAVILYAAYESRLQILRVAAPEIQQLALRVKANTGRSLLAMSEAQPVMLVFLRHLGCAFCRESLADLAVQRGEVSLQGVQIALVHMGGEEHARALFAKYGLDDLPRVDDNTQSLYRAFGLGRGRLMQLFGPRVWWRQWMAGVWEGHGFGGLIGDGLQMPGIFVVYHGEVVRNYVHQSLADRPNYRDLAAASALHQQ